MTNLAGKTSTRKDERPMGVKAAKNAAAFAAKNESQLQNERLAHLAERSEQL